MSSTSTGLQVKFTGPAEAEIKTLSPNDFEGKDPKQWHVEKVQDFATKNAQSLPGVTQGKVRKPAHAGGTDPNEAEHITVSYKAKNKDINSPRGGAWHVYTGR